VNHEAMTSDQKIPTRFVAHCEFCREQLDIGAEGVLQCTAGWVMQGGGDDIRLSDIWLREPQKRWAHRSCVKRAILAGRTAAEPR
jgi:hypothetical protein